MAYTQAMVDRSNVALPRQQYHQQAPYSPHGSANPSWSQTPATPPRVLGSSNGRAYSPSATRTPQMIKCSTCACLVPLLELSEHICNPGQAEASAVAPPLSQRRPMQTRQYSADTHLSGSSHSPYSSNGSQPRFAPHPLRLNVSHASGSLPSGPASASPTYIPPPRTPASLSPSPVHTPSNLSPQYGYTRSASASGSDNEDSHSHLSRSPKSPNSFDASASNNAGVGAGGGAGHMPFFEKYQKVYGPTHSNHSGSSAGGSMSSFTSEGRPQMTRAGTSPVLAKSPMSHGWPVQASNGYMQRRPSASDGQQLRQHQPESSKPDPTILHHKRDQSDSAESQQSSADSSSRDSNHLLNYLDESPDTSPDMPTTPVFRNLVDELSPEPKGNNNRKSETGSHQAEDDIIDSYPTPQAGFSERFGSLKVDEQQTTSTQIDLEIPELGPMEVSSPLLRSFSGIKGTQGVRSLSKGLPMSQSTPDSLARLAGSSDADAQASSRHRQASGDGRPAGISASKSLNQRRRSKTSALSPAIGHVKALGTPKLGAGQSEAKSAQIGGDPASAGLGLDARLDDLLKDMNRESLMGSSTPKPAQASTSAISAERNVPCAPPRHCDSCVNVIPASRKAIKKDGQTFCKDCYAELYLPKCQKCKLTIESRAIGSGDGKIKGKYHAACFSCWECSSTFPTGDFYVFEQRPYCGPHYHELNGTLCCNPVCQEGGIEGPCVSLPGEEGDSGSRYHPSCFICSHPACTILLDEYHYILAGLPYCERHARELEEDLGPSSGNVSPASDGPREYGGHQALNSASKIGQDRRRSRSLDVPATSITELRKKAGSPSYFNRNGRMGNRGGPPPSAGNRRAEKRRTVIQDVSRR